MSENNENLQEETNDVSITDNVTGNTDVQSAADNTAEDTRTDPQQEIITQQKTTIDALMQRTEELTKQINTLLSMGVQISDVTNPAPATSAETNVLQEDYIPLAELGAEIGKHDRY